MTTQKGRMTYILVCDCDHSSLCHLLNICADEMIGRVYLDGKIKV